MIKLLLPVRDVFITQPFGANFVNFYSNLGLKGHNGLDFRAKHGCPILASHAGKVAFSGTDGEGGISITLEFIKNGEGFKTIYYHLLNVNVAIGEKVRAGDIIGFADNTGKYTTGDHLHFGMKLIKNGIVLNCDNGYKGAVDPSPYFANYHGKHWDKPGAYHRYGRKQDWQAEWNMRFKNIWLHRKLITFKQFNKIYDTEFINKLVYGGWDFESAINPAMNEITAHLKKNEYLDGKIPFLK